MPSHSYNQWFCHGENSYISNIWSFVWLCFSAQCINANWRINPIVHLGVCSRERLSNSSLFRWSEHLLAVYRILSIRWHPTIRKSSSKCHLLSKKSQLEFAIILNIERGFLLSDPSAVCSSTASTQPAETEKSPASVMITNAMQSTCTIFIYWSI